MTVRAETFRSEIVRDRRRLHSIPEPAHREFLTSRYVREVLEGLGLTVTPVAGTTGLVCDIGDTGPLFLFRADMDGIEVTEATGLPFASEHPGVMHACGHDGHMAMLLGLARVLAGHPLQHCRVRLLFQPAEERTGGARDMIAGGVLAEVKAVFGAHLWSYLPTGTVATRLGPLMASTERVIIDIQGKGGHAALPRGTADAVVTSGLLVTALQSVVSRGVNLPAEPAVLTLGTLQAGSAPNVIAASARLEGTIRALTDEVKNRLHASILRICDGVAAATDSRITVSFHGGYPALVNHPEPVTWLQGVTSCVEVEPVMAGEDFSYYLQIVPGCFFFLGAGSPSVPGVLHHHEPVFDFDEEALLVGVNVWMDLLAFLENRYKIT